MSKRLMAEYKKEFAPYKQAIATVQFPIGEPIPAALVKKVDQGAHQGKRGPREALRAPLLARARPFRCL